VGAITHVRLQFPQSSIVVQHCSFVYCLWWKAKLRFLAVRFREGQDTTGTTGFAGADQLDEDDLSPRRKEKNSGVQFLSNPSLQVSFIDKAYSKAIQCLIS
jgi:hypothetical protein